MGGGGFTFKTNVKVERERKYILWNIPTLWQAFYHKSPLQTIMKVLLTPHLFIRKLDWEGFNNFSKLLLVE